MALELYLLILELYLYINKICICTSTRVVFAHQLSYICTSTGRRGLVVGGRRNVRGGLRVPGEFMQVEKISLRRVKFKNILRGVNLEIFLSGANLTNLGTL